MRKNTSSTLKRHMCALLLGLVVLLTQASCGSRTSRVNNVPVYISNENFLFANVQQDQTDIQMQVKDNKLYVLLPGRNNEDLSVYIFDQNGVSKLEDVFNFHRLFPSWDDYVLGFGNGYIYIKRCCPEIITKNIYSPPKALICYDLAAGTSETLLRFDESNYTMHTFDESGFFYISTEVSSHGKLVYSKVFKNTLSQDKTITPNPRAGAVSDVLRNYNNSSKMFTDSQLAKALSAATELDIENHGCAIYPCAEGLLIHTTRGRIPLSLVRFDGSVTPIFEVDCLDSVSCFNCYGDYAFLSFVRYEKWDSMDYWLLPYENDTISGTYRIDLTDFSAKKISDNIYRGIFIFDNTSIFVCDKNEGVYQIDLNGNLMTTLINPSS